jgi:tetratricopeptide (TPR) repeat protein
VTFEGLDDTASVATGWHQMGIVYRGLGELEAAEDAYQRSLALKVELRNPAGEASTRGELGILYDGMPGRREEAVVFSREAADLYGRLGDHAGEGRARSHLAHTLVKLERFDEARGEIERALELTADLGPSAEPWKMYDILADLEKATGRPEAAAAAREMAVTAYADARRGGWQITQGVGAQVCGLVRQALAAGPEATKRARDELEALAAADDTPPYLRALAPVLVRVLDGERGPELWQHPDVDYDDAAEVLLLLERLEAGDPQSEGPDRAELLETLRALARENDIDPTDLDRAAKTQFVAAALLALAQKELEDLEPPEREALAARAEDLAADL